MKQGRYGRREGASMRLVTQLKSDKKPEKLNKKTTGEKIQLTEKDKSRIKNEIDILKKRLL